MLQSASAPSLESTKKSFFEGSRQLSVTHLSEFGETVHQALQKSLGQRSNGGPFEHIRTAPFRLRNTRSCDIVHSSMEDPLASYKTLEPLHHHYKYGQRRYHKDHGYKCFDTDTIVVAARDHLLKSKTGLLRTSTGSVTYSDTHRKKLELDGQELTRIVAHEGIPGGGHAWTLPKLERVFKERTGRVGFWNHYEIPFIAFLRSFVKTFAFYNHGEFVKLLNTRKPTVMDDFEDVLVRLAKAREYGFIEQTTNIVGDGLQRQTPVGLPELKRHRAKITFRLHDHIRDQQAMDGMSSPTALQRCMSRAGPEFGRDQSKETTATELSALG